MGKTKAKPAKKAKHAPPPAAPVGAPAPEPAPPQPGGLAAAPPAFHPLTLPLRALTPSPTNPRKAFDEAGLAQLAQSIRQVGVAQPLVVRPLGDRPRREQGGWVGVDRWEVVAGERRYRAAGLAGLTHVPCSAAVMTDDQVLYVQLVENEQRADVLPSERAAAFAALAAAGKRAEDVSAATGLPLATVRDLIRLAKLPDWALAAVDRGVLPPSTAALVAKVPGEAARTRAAAEVLLDTRLGNDENPDDAARQELRGPDPVPMSYRDAKAHLSELYTRQLKGAPFSLKVVDLVPGRPSCQDCPDRAGNNDEAKADGVRADVCLDPDCYREKVKAHDAAELLKGTRNGAKPAPDDFAWPMFGDAPPRGWCRLHATAGESELAEEFAGHRRKGEKLFDLLGLHKDALEVGWPIHAVLDGRHKLQLVIRTADARKWLLKNGVLKKPEPRPKPAPKADAAWMEEANRKPPPGFTQEEWDRTREKKEADGKPLLADEMDVHDRALVNARRVLREYGEEQFAALADLPDAADGGPVLDALRLVARLFAYDRLVAGGLAEATDDVLKERFGVAGRTYLQAEDAKRVDAGVNGMAAPQVLAFLLELAAAMELNEATERDAAKDLLDWAELDWDQLTDQARRELAGGETADAKLDRAEAEQAADTDVPVAKVGDYVRTSYGTGPYLVESVGRNAKVGRPTWSLTLSQSDRKHPAFLNELQRRPDGRILGRNGKDEVFVVPAGAEPGPTYWDWLKAARLEDDGVDNGPLRGAWMRGESPPAKKSDMHGGAAYACENHVGANGTAPAKPAAKKTGKAVPA